jgi:hypothetical protein
MRPTKNAHVIGYGTALAILLAALFIWWMLGCGRPESEVPFEPGKTHCVSKMTAAELKQAMAWKKWKKPPMDALYDPDHKPGFGESHFNEPDKPGRLYCPKGMILSWDLLKVGTPPNYADTSWAAHCYRLDGTI